ncbi:MAG: benzoyl-CoA 2,3-epoxidase subunit BoxB [Planctomycetes bacterium]|nr:benzoyl-CoA 2,3-epoxidase subunit BoxB [Planctomycetota bacterium]
MTHIDYEQKIPNNVDLKSDKKLQRALEQWQPDYLDWWRAMGPSDYNENDVYLRTAVSVERDGWAHFGYVKMPDYRWGIFLEPQEKDRAIGFGDHMGKPAWQDVPGEYRNPLRRIIVTQADTEPASVEQQRLLGHTAPSLYDLRNLFQVNVEEGRHLWAMVYLLQRYFGRDGREEAEELLQRRSGNADHPRILGTFNEPITDWLSFFCFTTYTDRDGKFQLLSLAESGFDPLARTCRFMLTEEAHHMFVGQTGLGRVIERSCQLLKEHGGRDLCELGGIPLEIVQKYVNFWSSSSNDLFGGEISSNASNFFGAGLKGRANEEKLAVDHKALADVYPMEVLENGRLHKKEVALRNAMNEVLRDEYVSDNEKGIEYFNKITERNGVDFRFVLPHRRFNRRIGMFSEARFDPAGNLIDEAAWSTKVAAWLPTEADRAYVQSLMVACHARGKIAGWIAPPAKGIDGQPFEFEYVRL